MSNPKLLNLDDLLAGDIKTVVYKNVRHEATEVTVTGYLERVKRAKAVNDDSSVEQKIEQAIEFLADTYPSFAVKELRGMTMAQLNALIAFTIAAPTDIAVQVENSVPMPESSPLETAAGNA